MNSMAIKQKKMIRERVRTNNIKQAAHVVKIAARQKNPDDFLQSGARRISVRP